MKVALRPSFILAGRTGSSARATFTLTGQLEIPCPRRAHRKHQRLSSHPKMKVLSSSAGLIEVKVNACSAEQYISGYLKAVWRIFWGAAIWPLELVCEVDFSGSLMCGAGPGDLGGSRGSDSAEKPGRKSPARLLSGIQPFCLFDCCLEPPALQEERR